jgi:hypothetical protein
LEVLARLQVRGRPDHQDRPTGLEADFHDRRRSNGRRHGEHEKDRDHVALAVSDRSLEVRVDDGLFEDCVHSELEVQRHST